MLDQSNVEPIKKYGKVVYFLGSSEFGETYVPKKITNVNEAIKLFGNNGSIIDSVKEIYDYLDDIDLYCVKITGNHSQVSLNVNKFNDEVIYDGLYFQSKESNEIYNELEIQIDNNMMYFKFPESFSTNGIGYSFNEYPTLGSLTSKINEDTNNGLNYVYVNTLADKYIQTNTALESVNPKVNKFFGGNSGMNSNKNNLYIRLKKSLELLESIPIDIIVPLNMFIDDVHPKYLYDENYYSDFVTYTEDRDYLDITNVFKEQLHYHQPLIDFCNKQKSFGLNTHIVMGMNPIKNYDGDIDYIKNIVDLTPVATKKSIPTNTTASYLSVFGGDIVKDNTLENNGYIQYACLLASVLTIDNVTNKAFKGNVNQVQKFDNFALGMLADLGITTMRYSELQKKVVVNSGVTTADYNSPLHYVVNVRMIQIVLGQIKLTLEKHIGKIISILKSERMIADELDNLFNELQQGEIIKDFDYNLIFKENENLLSIEVELETIYMVEKIKNEFNFTFKSEV